MEIGPLEVPQLAAEEVVNSLLDSKNFPTNSLSPLSEEKVPERSAWLIGDLKALSLPLDDNIDEWFEEFSGNLPAKDVPDVSLTPVLEEIYKLRHDFNSFKQEILTSFNLMDFKKIKKNRTLKNRCTFVNRRDDNCRGYICKVPGSKLCYAHHILSSSAHYPEKRKKLY